MDLNKLRCTFRTELQLLVRDPRTKGKNLPRWRQVFHCYLFIDRLLLQSMKGKLDWGPGPWGSGWRPTPSPPAKEEREQGLYLTFLLGPGCWCGCISGGRGTGPGCGRASHLGQSCVAVVFLGRKNPMLLGGRDALLALCFGFDLLSGAAGVHLEGTVLPARVCTKDCKVTSLKRRNLFSLFKK